MTILETIEKDYIEAMKEKNAEKVSVLRMLKSALANAKISKGEDLKDIDEMQVLNKEIKSRQDSVEQYKSANRIDLAKQEEQEVEIIKAYLPEQMSDKELEDIVGEAIKQTGATSMADMGKLMGAVIAKTQGKADNSKIAQIVKEKLG